MTVLDEANGELQRRRNVLVNLEARYFLAEYNAERNELHEKISECRISIRQQEARIARLERAGRN